MATMTRHGNALGGEAMRGDSYLRSQGIAETVSLYWCYLGANLSLSFFYTTYRSNMI